MMPMRNAGMLALGRDLSGDLATESDAVVGPAVLGIDLRRVREPHAPPRSPPCEDAMPRAQARHGLRRILAERPAAPDVVLAECRVHRAERGHGVGGEHLR